MILKYSSNCTGLTMGCIFLALYFPKPAGHIKCTTGFVHLALHPQAIA